MLKKIVFIIFITLSPLTIKANELALQDIIATFGNSDLLGQYAQPEPIIRRFINKTNVDISVISNTSDTVIGAISKDAPEQYIQKAAHQLRYNAFQALHDYTMKQGLGGAMTKATIDGKLFAPDTHATNAQGLLRISGWAGDYHIGYQYPLVLATICGKIIAFSDTGAQTAEAQKIHQNLAKAGFEMELQLQSFPRCDEPYLQVFAYDNSDHQLVKMAGTLYLPLTGAAKPGFGTFDTITYNGKEPQSTQFDISNIGHNKPLYQCANTDCAVIGTIESYEGDGSQVSAMILDETDDFYLIKNDTLMGWLPKA